MDNKNLEPIPQSAYDSQYYREFNRGFRQFESKNSEHVLFNYVKNIIKNNISSGQILDIGCGRGELLKLALEGDYRVTGIDYSEAALVYAKQVVQIVNNKKNNSVSIFNMDAKNIDFGNEKFDFITALDIVEHLHDWELNLLFEKVCNCMHTDSLFLIHTSPNKNIMIPVNFIAKIFGLTIKSSKYHINEQNISSLRRHLEKKFKIQKLWFTHDDSYWLNATVGRGIVIRRIAKLIDLILSIKIVKSVMKNKFFSNLLMSDIYIIVKKKNENFIDS